MRSLPLLFGIALAVVCSSSHADVTANEAALAREQVRSGVAAAQEGRWRDALEAFRRAYALSPQSTTLLNLASAEVQTGSLVSAAESYRKVVRAREGDVSEDQREAARRALAQVEPRIARLRVVVRAQRQGDRAELDGAPLAAAAIDADLPVDPGTHVVRVVRGAAEVARASRSLEEGQFVTLELEVAEPAAPVKTAPSGGWFASPWFWTGVGVVVVGGTFAVLCATTLCEGPSPHAGSLGSVKLP